MEVWLIFAGAGLVAGFLAGLLGIGGGFVIVPVLILTLPSAGIPKSIVPHLAIGTSLLCICATALSSAIAHHRRSAVDWHLFGWATPGILVGAISGALIAAHLSGQILISIFVSGALLTAVYLMSGHQPKPHQSRANWPNIIFGKITGVLSALLGIGGGSILVPILVYRGVPMVRSVGTAAACGLPVAIFGAGGYALSGISKTQEFSGTTGYLYWPAAIGIVVFSVIAAPLGARLAHYLPEQRLKQIFAVFLMLTSAQILYSHWS